MSPRQIGIAVSTIPLELAFGEFLVVGVGNVLDRTSQVVDRVEHQVELAPLGAHDQVVAQARVVQERAGR